MTGEEALEIVRVCVEEDRIVVKSHFSERMVLRGLFWMDVLSIIEEPEKVRPDGQDEYGRDRWFLDGEAADGLPAEFLCVFETSDATTIFVTMYWKD